jgi:ABC-type antimicrobial peptide transport system permease subunit
MTIKKYGYKIGVLKSLGAGNGDISLIFGIQVVLLALAAFILSIPASFIIMANVNDAFVNGIDPDLVFFSVDASSVFFVLIGVMAAVVISAFIPLIKLSLTPPTVIIRKNNGK